MAKAAELTRDQKYALRYGDAGALMAHLSPRARKQVIGAARARGLTVEGVFQPGPDALRSRSGGGLRAQALKTVATAYQPTERVLTDREAQIHALDDKRKLDNQFYRDWLSSQQAKADAVSQASDQQLMSLVGNAHDQVDARYAQASTQLNQQDAATPGTVSDPAQFKGNERLAVDRAVAADAAEIAKAAAAGQISRSQTERAAIQGSNFAQAAALESRRQGDTYQGLTAVAGEKHSLALQKAADVVKETSRLLDRETTKAQANQQFAALAEKLGVAKQALDLKSLAEQHNYQIKKSGVRTQREKLTQSAKQFDAQLTQQEKDRALNDKKYQLDLQKYGDAVAKDNYLKKHKLGDYASKKPGSDANLDKQTRAGSGGILQANAISTQPKYAKSYEKYKNHMLAKGVNIAVINAGWQYSRGGVGAQTVKNLRRMGVVVPKDWRAGS